MENCSIAELSTRVKYGIYSKLWIELQYLYDIYNWKLMPMNNKETTVILITSEMYIVEYWYLQTTFGSSFDEWVIIRASIIFLMKTEIDPYQWPQINKVDCNSYKFVNTPVYAIKINFQPFSVHFKFVFLEDVVFSVCQPR